MYKRLIQLDISFKVKMCETYEYISSVKSSFVGCHNISLWNFK